jgi:hypothetical protein
VHRHDADHLAARRGDRRRRGVRVGVERRRVDVREDGVAPRRRTVLAVAKNVNGVVTTARPGRTPSAASARRSASVRKRRRSRAARRSTPPSRPRSARPGAEDELLARDDLGERRPHLGADGGVLRREVEEGTFTPRPP